jgi:CDP-glucose 4,6-dehydratase
LNPHFWNGKRVFVTGHTGFKGSWLCLWLQSLGAEIIGFSIDVPTDPSLFEVAGLAEEMKSIEGDVRDLDRLSAAVVREKPDIVIHMAAQSLVGSSYEDPVETYATNVMGTVHVLESLRRTDSARIGLIVTSDKCYENREREWSYREEEPKGGHDPYSSSKGCAELVTSAYRRAFFSQDNEAAAIASARAGNVIGGGDWTAGRLVPDVMAGALAGKTVSIRNPDAVRPWQHVLNPLGGYLLLCERLWESREHADGWNFGPEDNDARPVRWLIDRLGKALGQEIDWRHDGVPEHEALYLNVDSSKARNLLDWRPRWDLEKAIESIVAWYREFGSGGDMRARTLDEIAAYQQAEEPLATEETAR